ncbi:hypothetical protein [Viscerimonas tarda]
MELNFKGGKWLPGGNHFSFYEPLQPPREAGQLSSKSLKGFDVGRKPILTHNSVPSGTQYSHLVPTARKKIEQYFYQHIVPDGTKKSV